MTPTQIELHNAHKARLQRIAAAAARVNPKTDSEFSAALNAVEEPTEAKAATQKRQMGRVSDREEQAALVLDSPTYQGFPFGRPAYQGHSEGYVRGLRYLHEWASI